MNPEVGVWGGWVIIAAVWAFVSGAVHAFVQLKSEERDGRIYRFWIRGPECRHCTKEREVARLRARLEAAQAESKRLLEQIDDVRFEDGK